MDFNVFNVEFDGIDKSGKDTLVKEMIKIFPNHCMIKSRGLLSQVAYSQLYNRSWDYLYTEGYIKNTLFIKLDVQHDDWYKRLQETNEIENNKNRPDVDFVSDYKRHRDAFENAWVDIQNSDAAKNYKDHFICYDTSTMSAEDIAKSVVDVLKNLNKIEG